MGVQTKRAGEGFAERMRAVVARVRAEERARYATLSVAADMLQMLGKLLRRPAKTPTERARRLSVARRALRELDAALAAVEHESSARGDSRNKKGFA